MKNFKRNEIKQDDKELKLTVKEVHKYMTPLSKLITFREETSVMHVLETLLDKNITGAPVLNESGDIVGLIDDKDCLNLLFGDAYYNTPSKEDTVSSYMSNVMRSIPKDMDIIKAANIFLTSPFKRLQVIDSNNKLIGQISRKDILRAIRDMKSSSTW